MLLEKPIEVEEEILHIETKLKGKNAIAAYLGTQWVRVMNPHPPLASGSHCSNVRTLCSRPPP